MVFPSRSKLSTKGKAFAITYKKYHKWNAASVFLQKQFYKAVKCYTVVKKKIKTDVSDCSPSSE